MKGQLLFLGCGSSSGCPLIGCKCEVCKSKDPRNIRLRPSVLIAIDEKKILVDTSPDLRAQALQFNMTHVDGVLLTHTHYDHIAGIDELRIFYLMNRQALPVLLSQTTLSELKHRYHYLFRTRSQETTLSAQLDFKVLEGKRGEIEFLNLKVGFFTYSQGGMEVTGFRFGRLAYVSDLSKYEETIFDDLKGVETLIVSALQKAPSYMHLSVEQAIAFSQRVGAKETYLMHLSHDLDYEKTTATLPPGVHLAYDGLRIDFEYE